MNLCAICQQPIEQTAQSCPHCGASQLSHTEGQLKRGVMLVNRYQIEGVLGSGGFASVYLAQDTRLGRACVVKEMLIPKGATLAERGELQHNFEREVQSLVALNHPGHASIPEIYDHFATRGANYLVMKYIEGQNVEQTLAQMGGRIGWQAAVRIGLAVSDALLYMHAQKPPVLHRDVKPANILVQSSGRIWLVDFGLSKAQPRTKTLASGTTAFGTAGYAPLEQWLEQAVSASDIYALGATLHHLITGSDPRQAFSGPPDLQQVRQQHGHFPPLRQFDSTLPENLEQLVSAAIHVNPTKRPTASQLKPALEALLSRQAPPFYFREGKKASTPLELVSLSLTSWAEARDYLYEGAFEKWLMTRQELALARQLQNIIQQEANRDIGLDQFLRILSPDLPPPQLKVKHGETNFVLHYSADLMAQTAQTAPSTKITLKNQGPGCFDGTFELSQPWLSLNQHEIVLPPDESQDLTLTIQLERLEWGKTYKNQLLISSNSGQAKLAFSLRTPSYLMATWSIIRPLFLIVNVFIIFVFIIICFFEIFLAKNNFNLKFFLQIPGITVGIIIFNIYYFSFVSWMISDDNFRFSSKLKLIKIYN